MENSAQISCGSPQGRFHYNISVGYGILTDLPAYITASLPSLAPSRVSKFVIVTDENLVNLYGTALREAFESNGRTALLKVVAAGEASKCRAVKSEIEDWMLANQCHRDTCVVAVGGGVVGDLAGYVAATYMRGVPFIQVPTSLLACVDSSIGGKTGIDSAAGKNLLGAFHQPEAVFIDLKLLHTLPQREFINGMAEIIKAGAIKSDKLFALLEDNPDSILQQEREIMHQMVEQAVRIKAEVVTEDEKEGGLRAILNFGHSVGHGIEAIMQPGMLHGECVSIGMLKEAEIARAMGYCSSPTVGRLIRCLKRFTLPTRVPHEIASSAQGMADVLKFMAVDKKNKNGVKMMTMLRNIGKVHGPPYTYAVSDEQIRIVMEKGVEMVPGKSAKGTLCVPGSKSISNRVLLMAALGEGTCRVTGLLHSDDTQVMMSALMQLGAGFEWEEDGHVVVVHGTAGKFKDVPEGKEIYLSNAGTAARFLTTCLTLAKGEEGAPVCLTGNHRMKERPIGPLVKALRSNGCEIEYVENEGCLPLHISNTGLSGGVMHLEGKVSSQYVSSVLISGPYARDSITLQLAEEHPTSLPYILMTTKLMSEFGVQVRQEKDNVFHIPTGVYKNPSHFHVEVDASSATYPLAMAAISRGKVTVEGLGRHSLQGDAQFHTLLRSMGCETSQTESTTTVDATGVTSLQSIELDMETMTDAFMTAVAVAAVAKGRTKITGIENQRVKECNRIAVMVNELSKMGIKAGELPDGIWVDGVDGDYSCISPVSVKCHNDHRIAMSFAVLGNSVPNILITDKECTDKTYPEFWDDCHRKLGLSMQPGSHHKARTTPELVEESSTHHQCVFLVGMRGAGKSCLGKAAAEALEMEWMDMDAVLSDRFGCSISEYVEKSGWDAFREEESTVLRQLTSSPPPNTVVSCGGGIVEREMNRDLLSACPYVVHIYKEDIREVGESIQRPNYAAESFEEVWLRRKPMFEAVSAFTFAIAKNDVDFDRINKDFGRFLTTVLSKPGSPWDVEFHHGTFFLSLTYGNVRDALELLPKLTEGVNAIEVRVDLMDCMDPFFVYSQLALIRRASDLPIIYTVRSKDQGGGFETEGKVNGGEQQMFDLLRVGVRAGAEIVDVEACWTLSARLAFLRERRHCKVISSFHAIQPQDVHSTTSIENLLALCDFDQDVDVVKVVLRPNDVSDVTRLVSVTEKYSETQLAKYSQSKPIIALCTTDTGKLSRVLNKVFTPVTHPELPVIAAPGQLSVNEILSLRSQLGMIPQKRKFYLFGSPIQHSPSPSMHNGSFEALRFPYTYEALDTTDINAVENAIRNEDFGGASVTIPHKLAVIPLLDNLSDAAREIGAVNTIIRTTTNTLFGDNTDWIGIMQPIKQKLMLRGWSTEKGGVGLVIGAGGTSMAACYAMKKLGLKVFVYNRTFEKAAQVAQRFGATAIRTLSDKCLPKVDVVMGTIPASANYTPPDGVLTRGTIVMDAAYKPAVTPLLAKAKDEGCVCIQGAEMLCEQAYAQSFLWTNCRVPKRLMAKACYSKML